MGGVCHQGLSRTSHRLTRGPSQTVKGLTRQNMALNCTHLQASAYHTNPDNLSEYREAMCPLCLHFPVLLLFIIIISHQEKSAFCPSLPARNTPPPPATTQLRGLKQPDLLFLEILWVGWEVLLVPFRLTCLATVSWWVIWGLGSAGTCSHLVLYLHLVSHPPLPLSTHSLFPAE